MLEPIPELDFFEKEHRYRWRGAWIQNNVSEVVNRELTPFAKAQIEKYKLGPNGWLVRGQAIHQALEHHLRGEPQIHDECWSPWLDALLDDPLFKGVETLATEYRVVDRYNSVAGSFDFLLAYKEGPNEDDPNEDNPTFLILGDLKTVSSAKAVSSRKPATAQLGAYAKMITQHHKLCVTQCVTVVSGPEKCKVIRESPEDECIPAWEESWGRFQATQPQFDF